MCKFKIISNLHACMRKELKKKNSYHSVPATVGIKKFVCTQLKQNAIYDWIEADIKEEVGKRSW